MKLPNLTKEQKQILILGAMLIMGGLYALFRFVLSPAMQTFKESGSELQELEAKLVSADLAISREAKIRADLDRSGAELTELNKKFIPPLENALSWATESVYRNARTVGVDVESVDAVKSVNTPWSTKRRGPQEEEEEGRIFVPFSVQVSAKCGFFDLVRLLEVIENENPFVCISALSVSSSMTDPQMHSVGFTVEWPMWKEGTGPNRIKTSEKMTNGDGNPAGRAIQG